MDIREELHNSLTKQRYFIMTLSIGSIGYIIKYTESIKDFTPDLYILLGSLICLLFSIFSGIRTVDFHQLVLSKNKLLIDNENILNTFDDNTKQNIFQSFEKTRTKSGRCHSNLVYSFYCGIICFILWRIISIW